ncbi:MAG: hypothetical protein A2W30_00590 [Ignavibacteria bacterium RBG_16_36_9]|nr:MAG: hypothetical protein A2W30_00590 [Ignavibacteria bacterium RBG_16_36_9]
MEDFFTVQIWLPIFAILNKFLIEGWFNLRDELEININLINTVQKTSPKNPLQNLLSTVIVSILIYLVTFSSFYIISERAFYFTNEYFISLGLFLLSIVFGASLSRKFSLVKQDKSELILRTLYLSSFITLLCLIILFLIPGINQINRTYILGSIFIGLVIESFYFILSSRSRKSQVSFVKQIKLSVEQIKLSIKFILLDGLILTLFCYIEIVHNIIPGNYKEKEFFLLGLVYLSWVISASATHKFVPAAVATGRLNAFEIQVKFYLRIISLIVISIIFLQLELSTAVNFIGALAGYSLVSSFLFMFLFADKIKNKTDEATVVFLKAYEMNDPVTSSNGKNRNGKYGFYNSEAMKSVVKHKLEFEYLKEYEEVFSVLDTILELKSFDIRKSVIINSDEIQDIHMRQPDSYQLFINLRVLNDQIKLNDYLLDVRKTLINGGVFVGALLPHHYRYRRYLKKHSFWIANTIYFFDFIWKRVFPKLPITREIYFAFSKEKDRAISLAEGLGRLVYCGFKVLDLAAVDDVVYFAAVKSGTYTPIKKFFYGPIFKMKRIGKDGKPIYVYKLRTMYPYSEFIQDFVYNHNKLEAGGKFKDDFRVPAWGRLFRKLWIDELPMLINWVKRELKFVGVRPISNQYLSLYSKEHQERRKNFKPGLIPPFYADMPKTIEEIELSEKKYLDAYEKNPIKTDIKYFTKAINNILVKKKRSA